MGKSNKALTLALASCLAVTLTACGGSDSDPAPLSPTTTTPDSGTGSPTTTPVNTGLIGPNTAHTINITYSESDALEDLKAGTYQRIRKAKVLDADGQAVADGTRVYLNAIDSIMARGTIPETGGASISGSVLTDPTRSSADGIDSINFDSAYAKRDNGTYHFIHEGSHLLLVNNMDAKDKIRTISSTPLQNQAIIVDRSYSLPGYPSALYKDTTYVIGESLLGIEIGGVDADGQQTTGVAYVNGGKGEAIFYVSYPANTQTANIGCTDTSIDNRHEPAGSARPYIIAYVNDTVATVKEACFDVIDGGTLTATQSKLPAGGTVTITLEDGGDGFLVPFANVMAAIELDDPLASITLDAPFYTTDGNGSFQATVTVNAGKGKVTFTYGEATVSVTVGS